MRTVGFRATAVKTPETALLPSKPSETVTRTRARLEPEKSVLGSAMRSRVVPVAIVFQVRSPSSEYCTVARSAPSSASLACQRTTTVRPLPIRARGRGARTRIRGDDDVLMRAARTVPPRVIFHAPAMCSRDVCLEQPRLTVLAVAVNAERPHGDFAQHTAGRVAQHDAEWEMGHRAEGLAVQRTH